MLTRTEHPIVDMVNEAIRLLASGQHPTRRRDRTAQCRLPTLARRWRQLCTATQ